MSTGSFVVRTHWYHPEWCAVVLATAGWVVLTWLALADPGRFFGSPEVHPPLHAVGHAALMVTAMMVPFVLPQVAFVAQSSLWSRRYRAAAGYLAGYLVVWTSGRDRVDRHRWRARHADGVAPRDRGGLRGRRSGVRRPVAATPPPPVRDDDAVGRDRMEGRPGLCPLRRRDSAAVRRDLLRPHDGGDDRPRACRHGRGHRAGGARAETRKESSSRGRHARRRRPGPPDARPLVRRRWGRSRVAGRAC